MVLATDIQKGFVSNSLHAFEGLIRFAIYSCPLNSRLGKNVHAAYNICSPNYYNQLQLHHKRCCAVVKGIQQWVYRILFMCM